MADTEVKASSSLGANEPPAFSPSTAPAGPWPDAPMRPNYVQPLPTPSSAYQAIAELNRGFENAVRNIEALQGFSFFPEEHLTAWGNVIGRMQAEASLQLLDAIRDRLMNNALYYDRLCLTREKQLEDPDDVLIEAEHRKRELAAERQRQEQNLQEDE
jgi:hypothetical protein